jgi:hypothetical protein
LHANIVDRHFLRASEPTLIGVDRFQDRSFIFFKHHEATQAIRVSSHRQEPAVPMSEREWLPEYIECLRQRLAVPSRHTDALWFSIISTEDGGARVVIGDQTVQVSPTDYLAVLKGGPLPKDHPAQLALAKPGQLYVHYSALASQRTDDDTGPLKFVRELQQENPQALIAQDPLDSKSAIRIQHLREFDKAAQIDLTAILPSAEHHVLDGKLIQNISEALKKEGVVIARYEDASAAQASAEEAPAEDAPAEESSAEDASADDASGNHPSLKLSARLTELTPNLVILSGHSDEELAGFVFDLGDKGILKDRTIIFESCETPMTAGLIRIMLADGARAVFAFEGKISPNQLEQANIDLARELSGRARGQGEKRKNGNLERVRDTFKKYDLKALPHVERLRDHVSPGASIGRLAA